MVFRRFLHPRQLIQMQYYCTTASKDVNKSGKSNYTADKKGKKPPGEEPPKNIKPIESFSRNGDDGTSKTLTGTVLPKDNEIFHAIGATEELLCFIGMAREHAGASGHDYTDKLKRIQTIIIDISTAISRASNKATTKEFPDNYTKELEDWIHEYAKQLPPPEQYIIPGGGVANASLHIARAICRKTERKLVTLVRQDLVHKGTLVYLNRLSDFLFTVSRIAAKSDHRTESIYIPKPDETVQAQ